MIIGISGKMQSGKNTVASIVQYLIAQPKLKEEGFNPSVELWLEDTQKLRDCESGWKQKAFATKLKQIVSILTGIPVENLEEQEVKNRVLGEDWWYCQFRDTSNGKTWRENLLTHEEIQNYLNTCTNRTVSDGVVKPTVRQLLQEIGTEAMRNVIHPNVWVNALMSDYKAFSKGKAHNLKDWSELYTHKECKSCKKSYSGYKRQFLCKECIEDKNIQFYPNWIITDTRFPNEMEAVKDKGGITIRVNRPNPKGIVDDFINSEQNLHLSETALDNHEFDYVIDNSGNIEELIEKVKVMLQEFKLI
jgi:hypothetical protein